MTVVAVALSDGVPLYELAAPCEIFGSRAPRGVEGWYDLKVCGPPGARVDRWFRADTEFTYDDLVRADTVVVPACQRLEPQSDLVEAVRARPHDLPTLTTSVMTRLGGTPRSVTRTTSPTSMPS